jgi:hypothetical protein
VGQDNHMGKRPQGFRQNGPDVFGRLVAQGAEARP